MALVVLTVSLALEACDRSAAVGDDDGIDIDVGVDVGADHVVDDVVDDVVVIVTAIDDELVDDESSIVPFVMFLPCVLLSTEIKSKNACCCSKDKKFRTAKMMTIMTPVVAEAVQRRIIVVIASVHRCPFRFPAKGRFLNFTICENDQFGNGEN